MLHQPGPNRAPTGTVAYPEQLAWHRLFQEPRFQEQPRPAVGHLPPVIVLEELPRPAAGHLPPVLAQDNELPRVGGDYDFIIPQSWPAEIAHIDRNVFSVSQPYPSLKPSQYVFEQCLCYGSCVARNGTALSSSCVNVQSKTLCDDLNCSVGPGCGNRFEQRYPLDLVESRAGLGVVSSQPIPHGAFVVEYVGQILLEADATARPDRRYQAQFKSDAAWFGGTHVFVDAHSCGNISRFINHSCMPNCALYECDWTNTTRLGIFAIEDIPPLRELTFHYGVRNCQLFTCQCAAHPN